MYSDDVFNVHDCAMRSEQCVMCSVRCAGKGDTGKAVVLCLYEMCNGHCQMCSEGLKQAVSCSV